MSSSQRGMAEVRYMLTAIACSLVDNPDDIRVEQFEQDGATIFRLHSPNEAGMLIGKQGRAARSMRILLSMNGRRLGQRILLDIVDPKHPERINASGEF